MSLNVPLDPAKDKFPTAPLEVHRETVQPEWIDYNGHMNVAYYVLAFDHATDRFFDLIDLGIDYVRRCNRSAFVLETHVAYLQEVKLGDPLRFDLQLLETDEKRIRYFFRMFHAEEGYLAATSEQLALHIDLTSRRAAPLPPDISARLAHLLASHGKLPAPPAAGKGIALSRKRDA